MEKTYKAFPLYVMGTLMRPSAAYIEATNTVEEANTAIAEEEKKLAEKLRLGDVKELETAMDAMEEIAEDGREMDFINLSLDIEIR